MPTVKPACPMCGRVVRCVKCYDRGHVLACGNGCDGALTLTREDVVRCATCGEPVLTATCDCQVEGDVS